MDAMRLQQNRHSMMIADSIAAATAYVAAYLIRCVVMPSERPDLIYHAALLPLLIALSCASLRAQGAYTNCGHTSASNWAIAIGRAAVVTVSALLALLFLLREHYASRAIILLFGVLAFGIWCALRATAAAHLRRSAEGIQSLQVVIIGTGRRAAELSRAMRLHSECGLRVVGHLDPDAGRLGTAVEGAPVLGTLEDISAVLKNNVVDEVLLAVPRAMIKDVDAIVHACEEEGVRLRLMADILDMNVARMQLVQIGRVPLLTLEPVAQTAWETLAKRAIDVILVLLVLPLLLPLMIVVAAAIKWDSKGPVFFVQLRVGQNKRLFPMFKFRTMAVGSEAMLKDLEHLNEAQGPIFKIAKDPRLTRVGAFLRKTSIDELPQLFNVLRGEMTLVGPRPMSVRDVGLFDKGIQRKRFSVKPGLTCLWQISGRSLLPFSRWLELDLSYIERRSLLLDLEILFKTIPVVFRGTGAI